MPEWQRQSVDRSLTSARQRARERSDRLVAATLDLIAETGDTDFTVHDVVARSKMSLRTFYKYFASKDDLLVAVHGVILTTEVMPRLVGRCDAHTDPVRRLKAFVDGLYEITTDPSGVARALTVHQNRLKESRPADLDRALAPQLELVTELLADAARANRLRSGAEVGRAALLLHHAVLAAVHARILGSTGMEAVSAEDLWVFCAGSVGVVDGEGPTTASGPG